MKPKQAKTLDVLQEWEGNVVEIGDTEFTADLIDLTAGASFAEEEADIPLTLLAEGDAAKVQVGSVFHWTIGCERSDAGIRKRVSRIALRDLGTVTKTDLREGRKWACKVIKAFKP